ncbi:hypothetical protein EYC80_001834 [Monilinia laxa]|uniref:Uncharacterized protein n=1 Tax=Monilinia laxa TaxID=61186 RepID=A0A5N6K6X2_MONLA|nr:hypothetical protein EYC80_001834 [Monilinia laxa]
MPSFTHSSCSPDDTESQISQHASSQNSYGPSNVQGSIGDLESQYYSNHSGFSNRHGRISCQVYSNHEALERQYHSDHSKLQSVDASSQNDYKTNDIESRHARNSHPQPSDIYNGNNNNQNKKMWQCLPIASSEDLEAGKWKCYFWNQEDEEICRNCGKEKVGQGRSWFGALKQIFGSRGQSGG